MIFIEEIKGHIDGFPSLTVEEKQKLCSLILYEFYYELHHCVIRYDDPKGTYEKIMDLILQLKKKL